MHTLKKGAGETLTRILSILALLVSFGSLYLNDAIHKESAESEVIKDAYLTFFSLDRLALDNWQLGHVFTTPDGYDSIMHKIHISTRGASAEKLIELKLKERALALQIFDYYEQTVFLLESSIRTKEQHRAQFLKAVESYFSGRLLRNPRLLYYWSILSDDYEDITKKYYHDNVLSNKETPLQISMDSQGPFY